MEAPGKVLELMTVQNLLLGEPQSGYLRPQTQENGKVRENHLKKSKLMSQAENSRISQFPKTPCQKMTHMKIAIDWILMSQPSVPVRLAPKSNPKFPAILTPWENPLF